MNSIAFYISAGFIRLHQPIIRAVDNADVQPVAAYGQHPHDCVCGQVFDGFGRDTRLLFKRRVILQLCHARHDVNGHALEVFIVIHIVAGHVALRRADAHMIPGEAGPRLRIQHLYQRTLPIHPQVLGVRGCLFPQMHIAADTIPLRYNGGRLRRGPAGFLCSREGRNIDIFQKARRQRKVLRLFLRAVFGNGNAVPAGILCVVARIDHEHRLVCQIGVAVFQ